MIEFQCVTKVFAGTTAPAVQELSLCVPKGKITVFVGPSGCGKTTSLKMINKMLPVTSGNILVNDVNIAKQSPVGLRRTMGYVMQQSGLLPHRTVVDNVAIVPRLLGVSKKQARADAMEVLERVGLAASLAKRYPRQLSGGQQQRVGVARALAADPPILLMDEPFSAVDPVVRGELQEELLKLQADLAKTIVFVTHDIDEAVNLGDQIAVFAKGGRLVQHSTPEVLLCNPVDGFVADFIGRDRGFRGLSFVSAAEVVVCSVPVLEEAVLERGEVVEVGQWSLVACELGRPVGWVAPNVAGGLVLHAGGSLFRSGDSLRVALDAVLSSPSGQGVAVDGDNKILGVIELDNVLDVIERERETQVKLSVVVKKQTELL